MSPGQPEIPAPPARATPDLPGPPESKARLVALVRLVWLDPQATPDLLVWQERPDLRAPRAKLVRPERPDLPARWAPLVQPDRQVPQATLDLPVLSVSLVRLATRVPSVKLVPQVPQVHWAKPARPERPVPRAYKVQRVAREIPVLRVTSV